METLIGVKKLVEFNWMNIRSIRINRGLTIKQVSEMSGIALSTTTQMMSHSRAFVRIDNLKKMAKALEVDMEILLKDGILPDEFYPIPFTMIAEVNSELIRAYRRKFNLSRRGLAKKCKFTES